MNVVALAARSYRVATRLAAGVWPITSPPAMAATLDVGRLEAADVLYLCLHGRPGEPLLWGDGEVPALSLAAVRSMRLDGALVYLAGCYGAIGWSDAFLAAGASAVVADRNEAWAGRFLPLGSHALGWAWLRWLERGAPAGLAWERARSSYAAAHRSGRDREMLATMELFGDAAARLRSRGGDGRKAH